MITYNTVCVSNFRLAMLAYPQAADHLPYHHSHQKHVYVSLYVFLYFSFFLPRLLDALVEYFDDLLLNAEPATSSPKMPLPVPPSCQRVDRVLCAAINLNRVSINWNKLLKLMHLLKQRQPIFCAYPYIFYHFTVFRILYSCEKRNIFVFVRWQISILSCNNDFFIKSISLTKC